MPASYNAQNLRDIVDGAAFLGSGGGGPMAAGHEMIKAVEKHAAGKVDVVHPPYREVADDAVIVMIADIGGADTVLPNQDEAAWNAYRQLRDHLKAAWQADVAFVVPGEIGAENSLAPVSVAARAGIPVLDGDGSRRAVPTLPMTSFALKGIAATPAAIAGPGRDTAVLHASDVSALESLARNLTMAKEFDNSASMAFWPMRGADFKKAVIPGGLELAREVGASLREAREANRPPLDALEAIDALKLCVLLTGRLGKQQVVAEGGFDLSHVSVTSEDPDRVAVAVAKNEILIAWDGQAPAPIATAPDTITLLTDTGQTFSLAEADDYIGRRVHLICVECVPELRDPAFTDLLRPEFQSLGFYGPPRSPF